MHIPAEAAYLRKNEIISEVPEAWKDALHPYPTSNTLHHAERRAVPMLRQCYYRILAGLQAYGTAAETILRLATRPFTAAPRAFILKKPYMFRI